MMQETEKKNLISCSFVHLSVCASEKNEGAMLLPRHLFAHDAFFPAMFGDKGSMQIHVWC